MIDKKKLIQISFLILFLSFALYFTSGSGSIPINDREIVINKGSDTMSEIEIDISSDTISVENYILDLKIPDYSEKDMYNSLYEFEEILKKKILGNNDSFYMITENMEFPLSIEGYPFEISYETEDENLISNEGIILSEDPFDSSLTIYMSYGSFYESISIPIHVEPDNETGKNIRKEKLINNILSAIYENDAMIETEESYLIKLPGDVDGETLTYFYSGQKRNPFFLVLGPIAVVFLFLGFKKDRKDNRKDLERQMLDEYPAMIQKMSLYLSSGMTIRNIWILLYEEAEKKNGCKNPLYMEMRTSVNELRSGISEGTVYKNFGKRVKVPEIVRFTALLSQNLKKGSTSLAEQLMEESEKAFEEKKQRAVRKGEEAGTKLLGPMMLILLDVMVMIILPAFWNI